MNKEIFIENTFHFIDAKNKLKFLRIKTNQTKKKYDNGGIRTHALSNWCLKPAP